MEGTFETPIPPPWPILQDRWPPEESLRPRHVSLSVMPGLHVAPVGFIGTDIYSRSSDDRLQRMYT